MQHATAVTYQTGIGELHFLTSHLFAIKDAMKITLFSILIWTCFLIVYSYYPIQKQELTENQ